MCLPQEWFLKDRSFGNCLKKCPGLSNCADARVFGVMLPVVASDEAHICQDWLTQAFALCLVEDIVNSRCILILKWNCSWHNLVTRRWCQRCHSLSSESAQEGNVSLSETDVEGKCWLLLVWMPQNIGTSVWSLMKSPSSGAISWSVCPVPTCLSVFASSCCVFIVHCVICSMVCCWWLIYIWLCHKSIDSSLVFLKLGLWVGSFVVSFVCLLIGPSNLIKWLIRTCFPAAELRIMNAFA